VTPIGICLLNLRHLATCSPDLPATHVVAEDVVQVVALLDQRHETCTTVCSLCCLIARFGGFLARTHVRWSCLSGRPCGTDGSVSTPSYSAFLLPPSSLLHDGVSTCQVDLQGWLPDNRERCQSWACTLPDGAACRCVSPSCCIACEGALRCLMCRAWIWPRVGGRVLAESRKGSLPEMLLHPDNIGQQFRALGC
jgi:hypothetical protein